MSEIVEASELLERRNLISFFSTAQHSGVKNLLASFNYPYNTRTSFCTDAMKNTTMDNDIAKCFYLLVNSRILAHNIFDPINKKLCTGHPKWEPSLAVVQPSIGHHASKAPRQLILSDYSRIAWFFKNASEAVWQGASGRCRAYSFKGTTTNYLYFKGTQHTLTSSTSPSRGHTPTIFTTPSRGHTVHTH